MFLLNRLNIFCAALAPGAPQRYYQYRPSSPPVVIDDDTKQLLAQCAYFNVPVYVDRVWVSPQDRLNMVWDALAPGDQQNPYRQNAVTLKDGKVMQFVEHGRNRVDPLQAQQAMHDSGLAPKLHDSMVLQGGPQSFCHQGCKQQHLMRNLRNMSHALLMDPPGGPLLSQWIAEHGQEVQNVSLVRRLVLEMTQVIKRLRNLGMVHTKADASKWIMLSTGKVHLRDPEGMVTSSDLCVHGVVPEFEALMHTDAMGLRLAEVAPVFYTNLREQQDIECSHVDAMAWVYGITVVWPFLGTVF